MSDKISLKFLMPYINNFHSANSFISQGEGDFIYTCLTFGSNI